MDWEVCIAIGLNKYKVIENVGLKGSLKWPIVNYRSGLS